MKAHVNVPHIVNSYYTWIDVIAENKYGKTVETIEIPPFSNKDKLALIIDIPSQSRDDITIKSIEVYDISGRLTGIYNSVSDLRNLKSDKTYIVKFNSDSQCKVIKYYKTQYDF